MKSFLETLIQKNPVLYFEMCFFNLKYLAISYLCSIDIRKRCLHRKSVKLTLVHRKFTEESDQKVESIRALVSVNSYQYPSQL